MPYRRLLTKPLLTYDLTLRTYIPSNTISVRCLLVGVFFCHFVTFISPKSAKKGKRKVFERKPEKTIDHDKKLDENVGAFNQFSG